MTHVLFEPITIRDLTVRNRIWVSPMCQYSVEAQDGVPTPWHLVHLGSFAKGGAGAVVVEATGVVPEGRISPQDLGLWNDEQRDAFRPIVDFVHSQGAAAGIQLAHAGRKASTFRPWESEHGSVPVEQGGWQTVAPSADAFDGYAEPRELAAEDVRVVALSFAAAARRAVDAGFDLVELHAAHGYLLHQFLSPLSNHREDHYGGSLENRARALLEVLDAVRAEVGEGFPVVVRFSATDWVDGGLTLDETVQVARWAAEHGADLADVSTGGNVSSAPIPVGPGYQVPFAAAVKREAGIGTIAVGMISEAFQAEQVVATGQADVVMVGREFLRDPSFALRAAVELGVRVDYEPQQYHRARVTA
ncbi:NADH:flavin oxidoreductase/NADH oxidase [Curtobacterium luteum]|uniref:Oxidoreductase n=1 Tax=Curtobacterium luteum TaxID=33881 RepID=A0A175RKP5_9MICO|nr:NADH:flavin oxidoreductase/NADH oxidase [Curtobacterium luteum]KTR04350.1 oxidoreductase [Curtobacterium luteum]